jgi:hypothetical protein
MTNKEKFDTLLEQVFDLLYKRADKIVIIEKPCEHTVNAAGHSCIGKSHKTGGGNRPQCCCDGCKLFRDGCKAEKPLTCKCWLCPIAQTKHPKTANKLWKIDNLVLDFGFWASRGDKSESLAQATRHFCSGFSYRRGLKKLIILIQKHSLDIETEILS